MKASSSLTAHLQNLRTLLWILFWIGTALVAIVWSFGWGEVQLAERIVNPDLRAALTICLRWLDASWITLAAVNIYLVIAAQEGLATTRRWALTTVVGSTALLLFAAKTGWPFGPITFTSQLGPRLLELVPATLPLLWFVVVASCHLIVRRNFPMANPLLVALGTGALTIVSAFCIELVAWKIRAFWLWNAAHPPLQNYLAWGVAGAVLSSLLREQNMSPHRPTRRPLALWLAVNGVCALTWLVWHLYQ